MSKRERESELHSERWGGVGEAKIKMDERKPGFFLVVRYIYIIAVPNDITPIERIHLKI
jgi:hypothetical protein